MNRDHNDEAFLRWKEDRASNTDLALEAPSAKGELKNAIKRRIKEFLLLEQQKKCSICGIENVWNGKELVFILDHIDGNPFNHMKSNLRLICSNCDSQLDTSKSKNRGHGRISGRHRYRQWRDTPIGDGN